VLGTLVLTRGSQGTLTMAMIYGLVGLPFGLLVAALSRLSEKIIGWPGATVAMILLLAALYLLAPNKQNYSAGFWLILPYVIGFAVVWSSLSLRGVTQQ